MSDAAVLHNIYLSLWRCEPAAVWKVGSRDGRDALALAAEFGTAPVLCFEPHPDRWARVAEAVSESPRIETRQCVLTNVDGKGSFLEVDPGRTETPIGIRECRADTLINAGATPPDLVWMDVQGSELLVLQGFGARLSDIKVIQVRLSLQRMHDHQPRAAEVVNYLRAARFRWHSVVRPGAWRFDAVFVRPDHASLALEASDLLLRISLGTRSHPGIVQSANSPVGVVPAVARSQFASSLERSQSRFVASGASLLRQALSSASRGRPLPRRARQLFEMSQRTNPLRPTAALPTIDAVVPCANKDMPTLSLVIASIRLGSDNPVDRIVVVVPGELVSQLAANLDGCEVVAEEDLLDGAMRSLIRSSVPEHRRGWVTQQLAKFEGVTSSSRDGVLVVDADTVLLRPRTWLAGSRQLLVPVHEFHSPYEEHFQRVFGQEGCQATVSWGAHHQLMRPSIVKAMFGVTKPEQSQGLREWVQAADFSQDSALSEYHSYGRWVETRASSDYALGRWGNAAMPRHLIEELSASSAPSAQDAVIRLRTEFPTRLSISMHSYLPPTSETTDLEIQ